MRNSCYAAEGGIAGRWHLPDLKITPVHRSGASGTTFVVTNHLSTINQAWKKGPGAGMSVPWPAGVRAMGNDGIAEIIQKTPGAIGYLGYGSALKHKLALASLENKAGKFVAPTLESSQAGVANLKLEDNLRTFVPDPEGDASYPLVTFTWIVARKKYSNPVTAATLKNLLNYGLSDTQQKESSKLGYIPLPPAIVEKVLKQVDRLDS